MSFFRGVFNAIILELILFLFVIGIIFIAVGATGEIVTFVTIIKASILIIIGLELVVIIALRIVCLAKRVLNRGE